MLFYSPLLLLLAVLSGLLAKDISDFAGLLCLVLATMCLATFLVGVFGRGKDQG